MSASIESVLMSEDQAKLFLGFSTERFRHREEWFHSPNWHEKFDLEPALSKDNQNYFAPSDVYRIAISRSNDVVQEAYDLCALIETNPSLSDIRQAVNALAKNLSAL